MKNLSVGIFPKIVHIFISGILGINYS